MDAAAHPTERYRTLDYHTAGEPFRIVVSGVPELPGRTVADRRIFAMNDPAVQRIRALLCSEPRGHADMYGGFITPPDDDGADVGVLFWHKDGFSTACGHGTIALGVWAVQTGLVRAPSQGSVDVTVDVPSGRVRARVRTSGGRIADVAFVNVPSWVHARDVVVPLPQGPVTVDIAYGGAMYAVLPAAAVGLQVRPEDYAALIDAGRAIRDALNAAGAAQHPHDPRLSGTTSPSSPTGRSTGPRAARAPRPSSPCSMLVVNCPTLRSCATSRSSARSSPPASWSGSWSTATRPSCPR
jgi:proline racemase